MKKDFSVKKDKYSRVRGGKSKILKIFCSECHNFVLLYQKDGFKGQWLKRLYLDRIISTNGDIKSVPTLVCQKCGNQIGTPMIYKKENRQAILLRQGSFIRRELK